MKEKYQIYGNDIEQSEYTAFQDFLKKILIKSEKEILIDVQ